MADCCGQQVLADGAVPSWARGRRCQAVGEHADHWVSPGAPLYFTWPNPVPVRNIDRLRDLINHDHYPEQIADTLRAAQTAAVEAEEARLVELAARIMHEAYEAAFDRAVQPIRWEEATDEHRAAMRAAITAFARWGLRSSHTQEDQERP